MAHSRNRYRLAVVGAVVGLALIVTGCDLFEDAPTTQPAQEPAETKTQVQKTAPAKAAGEGVLEYKRPEFPQGRRDPFVFEPPPATVADEQEDYRKGPLEHFEVARLKLIAIVTGTAVPKAMFVDDTGFGHLAKEGDRIGRGGGKITAIRDNEVEITINQTQVLSSDEELEDPVRPEREESEPVIIIIRLSDSELELGDSSVAEGEEILEELDLDDKKKNTKAAPADSRVQ